MTVPGYPRIDEKGRTMAHGTRKTATARVILRPGTGQMVINGRHWVNYIPEQWRRTSLIEPLLVTEHMFNLDVTIMVKGGGITGQIDAAKLALSRAIQKRDPELRYVLKRAGFLTRDPRAVERKKTGLKKARKRRQWVKR